MEQASGDDRYDLAIIGSGGAGFAAACHKQRRVVMIERATIGGTCVNTGRAPSRALLAASYGWDIVHGQARFVADPTDVGPALRVDLRGGGTQPIRAAHYLVATGSTPWAPPIPGLNQVGYLTSTTAMELAELPRSLLVVGGSAVGLEKAQLFARLGAAIAGVFADEGIGVRTGAQLTRVARDGDGRVVATVRHHDGSTGELRAERLLVATGRRPVSDGLNLEAVGVKVGEQLRTHNPRIWTAGDVTGAPQFVYVAAAHGALVADNALDQAGRTLDYRHLPRVIFTSPQLAAVGMTDAQAAQQGIACARRVLLMALGEAPQRCSLKFPTRAAVA
jgi:mercuric reductase